MRLRDADGGEGLAAGAGRRTPLRPHRAGLGDRPTGEAPDPRPAAAQPAHAGNSAQTEPPRLQHRHRQVARAGPTPRRLAQAGPPPPPRGPPGRGTRPADPADRADDQDPGGVQPPGGRAAAADPPAQRRKPRRQTPRPPPGTLDRRVPQHPAGDPGIAHQPAEAGGLSQANLRPLPGRQTRPLRRQPAAGRLHRQEVPQPRTRASST